jgi:zeaxanthin glucosyltransferase
MAHFGIFCPPVTGHIDPLAAVGRTLIQRGHHVTVFSVADVAEKIAAEGLGFAALAPDRFTPGTLARSVERLASLKGMASLNFAVRCACEISDVILRAGPGAVRSAGIDALLVDQNEPAGATVAEHLRLPFLSTCTSLPLNREPAIPPPFTAWPYSPSLFGRVRNRVGFAVADRVIAPIQAVLNRYRAGWRLPHLWTPDDSFSKRAQIAQLPVEFDFPRRHLPETFHYLGPWFDARRNDIPFPFERLDGRPLVYGSLGTLQPEQSPFFGMMAEACSTLEAQLVLSLGKRREAAVDALPGNPIVVNYLPQIEILSRAAAVITHSGMNTTQQALSFGVPLVAIPLTHDQPAIAVRTARTGAGIVLRPQQLSARRLRTALELVLASGGRFRTNAMAMAEAIRRAGGREKAADIAESCLI